MDQKDASQYTEGEQKKIMAKLNEAVYVESQPPPKDGITV
jgi:hypothetical protein